jgi:hypothetical protein
MRPGDEIEHYEFGLIRIDGREEHADLLLTPTRVLRGWWRREGHVLAQRHAGRDFRPPGLPRSAARLAALGRECWWGHCTVRDAEVGGFRL